MASQMLHMPSLLIVNFSFRIVKHIYNIGFIFLQGVMSNVHAFRPGFFAILSMQRSRSGWFEILLNSLFLFFKVT